MDAADTAPVPGLAARFVVRADAGPAIAIGRLATGGTRRHLPVAGGTFAGDGIDGTVVGGSETALHRPDGVIVIEAVYLVHTADGAALRLIGTGYQTDDAGFAGTRMTIVFETDEDGPQAWLTTRAFVGERRSGDPALAIFEIL